MSKIKQLEHSPQGQKSHVENQSKEHNVPINIPSNL